MKVRFDPSIAIYGAFALLLAVAPPYLSVGQSPNNVASREEFDFSSVRALIETRMAATNTPAMSITVARGPNILWEQGFGFIDYPGGTVAGPNTRYYCASVTKVFTATALMMLQERKQLDLDHPANEYLGSARLRSPYWNTDQATVRRIATQTSGLATYDRSYVQGLHQERVSSDEIIRRYGIVVWRPGDHFDYTNLNYGILGEAIANVSKRSYGDFLRDEIFRPLGMSHSSLGIDPAQSAAPRFSSALKAVSPQTESTMPGASSVYSTAHDLALFGMFQLQTPRENQHDILSPLGRGRLVDPSVDAGGGDRHSLGWWISDDRNGFHTLLAQGGTVDSQSWLLLVPSEKISVSVIGNSGSAPVFAVADEILATMLPLYKQNREEKAQYAAAHPAAPPSPPKPPPVKAVGAWAGTLKTYRSDIPLTLNVTSLGEIKATLGQGSPLKLTNPRFRDNRVTGKLIADLGVADTDGVPYEIHLELYRYGSKLIGAATTYALPGLDGPRLSFAVELTHSSAE